MSSTIISGSVAATAAAAGASEVPVLTTQGQSVVGRKRKAEEPTDTVTDAVSANSHAQTLPLSTVLPPKPVGRRWQDRVNSLYRPFQPFAFELVLQYPSAAKLPIGSSSCVMIGEAPLGISFAPVAMGAFSSKPFVGTAEPMAIVTKVVGPLASIIFPRDLLLKIDQVELLKENSADIAFSLLEQELRDSNRSLLFFRPGAALPSPAEIRLVANGVNKIARYSTTLPFATANPPPPVTVASAGPAPADASAAVGDTSTVQTEASKPEKKETQAVSLCYLDNQVCLVFPMSAPTSLISSFLASCFCEGYASNTKGYLGTVNGHSFGSKRQQFDLLLIQ